MTKEQSIKEHRKMWNEIAKKNQYYANNKIDAIYNKDNYFSEHINIEEYNLDSDELSELNRTYCFLCSYSKGRCNKCPLIWGKYDRCYSEGALYNLFEHYNKIGYSKILAKIARQIATLKVKDN